MRFTTHIATTIFTATLLLLLTFGNTAHAESGLPAQAAQANSPSALLTGSSELAPLLQAFENCRVGYAYHPKPHVAFYDKEKMMAAIVKSQTELADLPEVAAAIISPCSAYIPRLKPRDWEYLLNLLTPATMELLSAWMDAGIYLSSIQKKLQRTEKELLAAQSEAFHFNATVLKKYLQNPKLWQASLDLLLQPGNNTLDARQRELLGRFLEESKEYLQAKEAEAGREEAIIKALGMFNSPALWFAYKVVTDGGEEHGLALLVAWRQEIEETRSRVEEAQQK